MINYLIKKEVISLNNAQWKDWQNKIIFEAVKQNQRIDPNDIIKVASKMVLDDAVNKIQNQLDAEDKNAIVAVPPLVLVTKIDANHFDAQITVTYYPFEEIKKIDYKNLNINFQYLKSSNEFLNEAFVKFTSNYPLLYPVNDFIRLGDFVEVNLQMIQNGQIKENQTNIVLEAKESSNNFLINSTLLNRQIGEFYQVNDPMNQNWSVTILGIKRAQPTILNDSNIHLMNIPGVTNLAQLKNKIEYDFIKDRASNELLRYYELAISHIIDKNEIVPSEPNIRIYEDEIQEKFAIKKPKKDKNPEQLESIIQEDAIGKIKFAVIETAINKLENIKISDKEIDKEHEYLKNVAFYDNKMITREAVETILNHQKVALTLAKMNNPDFYKQVVKDMDIKL